MKHSRQDDGNEIPISLALPIGLYGLAVCGVIAYLAFVKPSDPPLRVYLPEPPKADNVIVPMKRPAVYLGSI